mgnify:CR=1 FL=1
MNNFFNEYLVSTLANILIIDKIFTIDFVQSLIIVIVQVFITVIVRLLFNKITSKIKK